MSKINKAVLLVVGYACLVLGGTLLMNKAHAGELSIKEHPDELSVVTERNANAIAYMEVCAKHCTFSRMEQARALRQHVDPIKLQGKEVSPAKSFFYKEVRLGGFKRLQEGKHEFYTQDFNAYVKRTNDRTARTARRWVDSLSDDQFKYAVTAICSASGTNCPLEVSTVVGSFKYTKKGATQTFPTESSEYHKARSKFTKELTEDLEVILELFSKNELVFEDIAETVAYRDYLLYIHSK